jgi:endo-1,4-beta-xylanase
LLLVLIPLVSLSLGASTCYFRIGTPPPEPVCGDPGNCRLWEAAALSGVRFGFHDENGAGGPDGELAAREGNVFTNHGLSWSSLEPTRGVVTASMDAACGFAADNDLFQVGYHFVWEQQLLDDLPDWVQEVDDPEELRSLLRRRVREIFARCPGLDRIDVVNEPLQTLIGTALHRNHFHEVLGPDYIAELFQIVRDEAPEDAELFINENFIEYFPDRAAAFVALVRDLVEGGAPVDAVGLQTHLMLPGKPNWAVYRETMEQLGALGVKVFVTELDVPVAEDLPDRFERQAERYTRVVETCLAVPACDTIIVWGIDDGHTWLQWFGAFTSPEPLLFDDALLPKPSYFAVRDALLHGRGGDHPVSGSELRVTRMGLRGSLVRLSSRDPGVRSPTPRSTNDPSADGGPGVTIELSLADGTVHEIFEPRASGWRVSDGLSRLQGRKDSSWPSLRLDLREGSGLDLMVWVPGLDPVDALAGLRARIGIGSLRTCLEFDSTTVVEESPEELIARDAPRASGYDCSFEPAP